MNCPNCGRQVMGQFCTGCGARLAQVASTAKETPHFRIHVTAKSFAEQNLPSIASRLENAYGVIIDILGVELHGAMIDVHLSELVVEYGGLRLGGGGYAIPRRMQIHDVYLPDAPGDSLERSLLVLILALATESDSAEPAPLIVDGLLSLAMQRLGSFPPPDVVQGQLGQAKMQYSLPTIESLVAGPTKQTEALYYPAAASVAQFLITTRGLDSFKTFAGKLNPEAPDQASQAAYHTTFHKLGNAWSKSVTIGKPGGMLRFIRMSGAYLGDYKFKVAEIVLYICVAVAFTIGLAKVQQFLFDHALPRPNPHATNAKNALIPGDLHLLAIIMGSLVVAFGIVLFTSWRQSYLTAYVSESVLKEMRLKMFSLVQRLQPGYFQTTRTGDIMSRMTSDMAAVQNALTGSMAQGFRMMLTLVAAVVTIFLTDWKLAFIAMVGTPLFFISSRYLGPAAARASKERQRQLANSTSTLQENLSAQPVVKAFGLENRMVDDYTSALSNVFRSSLRLTYLTGLYSTSANSVATGINLAVLGLGAYFVIQGPLTYGILVAFLGLIAQVIGPVQNISSILQGFQQASGAMDRIDEMLRLEPTIKDSPTARPIPRLSGGIRLENVQFGYSDEQVILNGVSIDIPAGSNVALVGPSGCGKSTILNMIMRFYDPNQGRVTFDGIDIREGTLDSVRGQMGIVFQDSILFNISIRENIRLGRLEATDEEVEAAAKAAEIHDLIMSLPDDYDTVVGERGSRLSGGQRQRMAIARAIVRNPSILVLDEATSALDARTEAAINATFERIGQGRTTISVTHRLSSVINADRILVFERGRLVEQGTHDELLQKGGLYAGLWQEQGGVGSGHAPAAGGTAPAAEVMRLRSIPMFAQLPAHLLEALSRRLFVERFAAGDTIISQGDVGDKLYVLQRGQVDVLSSGPTGRPLATLNDGDYFGEMALLHDAPRVATVRARTPVQVYSMRKEDFKGLMSAVPQLRQMMEQVMAQRAGVAIPAQ